MIDTIFIVVFVISVSSSVAAALMLQKIAKQENFQSFYSYLYYIILAATYGIYSIFGSVFVNNLLVLTGFEEEVITTIVEVMPLLGLPVLITAWYLLIRFSRELIRIKTRKITSIGFFTLALLLFVFYGLKIRELAEQESLNLNSFIESFKLIIIGLKILTLLLTFIPVIALHRKLKDLYPSNKAIVFSLLFIILHMGVIFFLIYLDEHIIYTFLFIFLYFTSDFFPVLYIYLQIEFIDETGKTSTNIETNSDFLNKYEISRRENEIIQHICDGKTNQEIADTLYISLQTVKDHVHNIFIKTGVKNRVQLSNLVSNYLNTNDK